MIRLYDDEKWQLVPKDATEAMLDAPEVSIRAPCFGCSHTTVGQGACGDVYKAMLAASPQPEELKEYVICNAKPMAFLDRHNREVYGHTTHPEFYTPLYAAIEQNEVKGDKQDAFYQEGGNRP